MSSARLLKGQVGTLVSCEFPSDEENPDRGEGYGECHRLLDNELPEDRDCIAPG